MNLYAGALTNIDVRRTSSTSVERIQQRGQYHKWYKSIKNVSDIGHRSTAEVHGMHTTFNGTKHSTQFCFTTYKCFFSFPAIQRCNSRNLLSPCKCAFPKRSVVVSRHKHQHIHWQIEHFCFDKEHVSTQTLTNALMHWHFCSAMSMHVHMYWSAECVCSSSRMGFYIETRKRSSCNICFLQQCT